MASRRLPRPWSVIEVAEALVVVDASGFRLCYIYVDTVERGAHSERMPKPAALKIASGIARLPDPLKPEGMT